jgi:hypothetical protein
VKAFWAAESIRIDIDGDHSAAVDVLPLTISVVLAVFSILRLRLCGSPSLTKFLQDSIVLLLKHEQVLAMRQCI